MNELPFPVRRVLRAGLDDLAIARIWQRIERSRHMTSSAAPGARLRALLVAAMVLALGALVVGSLAYRRAADAPVQGPLLWAAGAPLEPVVAAGREPRPLHLSDGSAVVLRPDSRFEVLANDGKAFVSRLATGAAQFSVKPGGPRLWTIECGFAAVEVVGTQFSVRCAPTSVHVDVDHGIVLVQSGLFADHARRLTDGQSLDVVMPPGAPQASANTQAPPPASPTDGRVQASAPAGAPAAPSGEAPAGSAAWRELADRGSFSEAYGMLGPSGVEHVVEVGAARDLLAVADVARLSGHPREAVPPLRRIVDRHADDPSAPLAAFTLGRVQLDALGDAADAADSFARALALHVPPELEEDAWARLVEARARAGDLPGARRAAQDYRARFPRGARSEDMRRWVREP